VILDHTTGEVLALVGSPAYDDPRGGQWNAALARRQPGSALKPFTYALAFADGRTPADLVADIPTSFLSLGGDYMPRNFSQTFHGPVRLRAALASSYNVAAVRVLDQVGSPRLLALLAEAGITTLRAPAATYGLGLTLGVGEVTLLDLCRAYAVFPRRGRTLPIAIVAEVTDRRGRPLPAPRLPASARAARADSAVEILPARAAFWVADILSDPDARLPAFGAHGPLELPFRVAAKTGTSSDFRDAWTVGFDDRYVVGIWVGNLDGEPLPRLSGARAAAPIFRVAWYALRAWADERGRRSAGTAANADNTEDTPEPASPFAPPPGLAATRICALSGGAPGPGCAETLAEWLPADRPPAPCAMHRRAGDGVQVALPAEYAPWLRTSALGAVAAAAGESRGPLRIESPRDGERFFLAPDLPAAVQTIALRATGGEMRTPVAWSVDGRPAGSGRTARWPLAPGRHRIVAASAGKAPVAVWIEVAPAE
jgi:penicillin-binding protein 1C